VGPGQICPRCRRGRREEDSSHGRHRHGEDGAGTEELAGATVAEQPCGVMHGGGRRCGMRGGAGRAGKGGVEVRQRPVPKSERGQLGAEPRDSAVARRSRIVNQR
jgi:hypothetical protein